MSFSAKKQIQEHKPLDPALDSPVDPLHPETWGFDNEGFPLWLLRTSEVSRFVGRSPKWIELRTKDAGFPSHLFKGARRFSLREIANWWGDDWARSWIDETQFDRGTLLDKRGFIARPLTKIELASLIGLSPRWVEMRTVDGRLPTHFSQGQLWYHLGEVVDWADETWSAS